MSKKSKELLMLEELEMRKTKIKEELIKVIRGYYKTGERLMDMAEDKDSKIITLKMKGTDLESEEIKTLMKESEELKKSAQADIINVIPPMEEYTSKLEKDYEAIKASYDALIERGKASPTAIKKMESKLEEASFKVETAKKLIEQAKRGIVPKKTTSLLTRIWRNRLIYLMILPSFIATLIFSYWPMYGVLLAFKDWDLRKGIINSPWTDYNGFGHFYRAFVDDYVLQVIKNTLIISSVKLVTMTIFVIGLALLLNEIRNKIFKRTVQSIIYVPHFLSWIVMTGILMSLFSQSGGVVNRFIVRELNGVPINIMAEPRYFRFLLYATNIWKGGGWGTIIYLAAIMGVSPTLYESAIIDGAGRFRQAVHITLPSIKGTIILLLILNVGGILNAGFDQVYNMMSPSVMEVADIIDTYVFRKTLEWDFSFGTAVGLAKNVVAVFLIVSTDRIAKFFGEEGIF